LTKGSTTKTQGNSAAVVQQWPHMVLWTQETTNLNLNRNSAGQKVWGSILTWSKLSEAISQVVWINLVSLYWERRKLRFFSGKPCFLCTSLTVKIVLVVQSCKVPTSQFSREWLSPICRITNDVYRC
jgi:hypothetical protein